MQDLFDKTIKDIKSIKIQGATAVAINATIAFCYYAKKNSKTKDKKNFWKMLLSARKALLATRPTEPAMDNSLNYMLHNIHITNYDIAEIVAIFEKRKDEVIKHFERSDEIISSIGERKIKNGQVIYTHCHSSTVTQILKLAKKNNKRFSVYITETRPFLQGRITARELSKQGIAIKYFVDSAARQAIKAADMMLIGADAISSTGKVINKIGSEMFAEVAKLYDVPVYVCTDSWKFDPKSIFGYEINIEKRPKEEYWPSAPKGVSIHNEIFEKVDPDLISGIISEMGIYPPGIFAEEMRRSYKWLFVPRK
ncbi:MAG TPA: S-methyl-5-thioribose-1-phosphate isomerase [Candidatus Woesearchaeota archaeon]|nr:S-methyl-5-thioribose-1-phosphate isomerase [Candidatus Woesearchaeota archaeon]